MKRNNFLRLPVLRNRFLFSVLFLLVSADEVHTRMVDDFSTRKNWTSETIEPNSNSPLFQVGIWSKPNPGPVFKVANGTGYFHFPKLEAWFAQGFEYAYHMQQKDGHGLQEFPGTNYFSVKVSNNSREPIRIKFRLMDEIYYNYGKENGDYKALCELKLVPDSFVIQPHTAPQKLVMKLCHPIGYGTNDIHNVRYINWLKFFAFEVSRTVSPTKANPTIDCTLAMNNMMICDTTMVKP